MSSPTPFVVGGARAAPPNTQTRPGGVWVRLVVKTTCSPTAGFTALHQSRGTARTCASTLSNVLSSTERRCLIKRVNPDLSIHLNLRRIRDTEYFQYRISHISSPEPTSNRTMALFHLWHLILNHTRLSNIREMAKQKMVLLCSAMGFSGVHKKHQTHNHKRPSRGNKCLGNCREKGVAR